MDYIKIPKKINESILVNGINLYILSENTFLNWNY